MRAGGSSNNSRPPVILIYRSRDRSFTVIRGGGWSLARTEGGSRAKGKRSIDLRMPIGPCGIFTSVRGPSLIVSSNRPRLTRPERRRLNPYAPTSQTRLPTFYPNAKITFGICTLLRFTWKFCVMRIQRNVIFQESVDINILERSLLSEFEKADCKII